MNSGEMSYQQIRQDVLNGQFAPVYYLYGVESWFIDKLAALIDTHALTDSEKAFNRALFYGGDATANKVLNDCRSFPMLANRRLVILKEAQRMPKAELDKLGSYLEKPVPSTVLVLVFKGRNAGLSRSGSKAAKANGVALHAKKMYDRDVRVWIADYIKDSGFQTENGIPDLLLTNLGTHLELIENELEKIFIQLRAKKQTEISRERVYEMINIDKEFNTFELLSSISMKNVSKSHMIIDRLTQNPKVNPPVLTLNGLFRFFHNLALVFSHKLTQPNDIKQKLGVNWFAAQEYAAARRHYPLAKVYQNLLYIEEADLMLKGVKRTQMGDSHILKTLVLRILS